MKKVVVGYTVHFKGHPDTRDMPVQMSIEGGQEAIKQWREGEPTVMLKGNAISTQSIAKIEMRHAWSDRDAELKLKSGDGILEAEATKQLAEHLGREDSLQPVSQFGSNLAKQLPDVR